VRTSHQMLHETGREPTPEEIAEKLAMPSENVRKATETLIVHTSRQMLHDIGREPTPEELAEKLAMPLENVRKALKLAKQPIFLESPIIDAVVNYLGDLIETMNALLFTGPTVTSEKREPPTEKLARAAKAVAIFPVPKEDQAVFQFWAFRGGSPTIVAVALQLKTLPLYDKWLWVLKEARAPAVEDLPAHAGKLKSPADIKRLMEKLREIFKVRDPFLEQRIGQVLDRVPGKEHQLLTALAELYAGPDDYYMNFYGPPGTIDTVSYESLLRGDKSESAAERVDLTDDTVFIGYSELSLPRPHGFYTSFPGEHGVDLSGVEIMATAYANLLNQETIRPSGRTMTALAVLSFGLIAGLLLNVQPVARGVILALAFTVLYAGFVQWQFNEMDLWLPLATPVFVQLPLAVFLGLAAQVSLIRKVFERYFEPDMVDEALKAPSSIPTHKKDVELTLLVADIRGWTTLSAELERDQRFDLKNRFLGGLVPIIREQYKGKIVDFSGDGIFVDFGDPDPQEDDPERAVACAVKMQLAMTAINERNLRDDLPELPVGIGIHMGEATIGSIGNWDADGKKVSGALMKYGPEGLDVDLTHRIAANAIRGQILISDMIKQRVPKILKLGEQIDIKVKGSEEPLSLHEVLGIGGRHKLFLPEANDRLVPLQEEIPIGYEMVEGGHHCGEVRKGALTMLTVGDRLTKRSVKAAEARLEDPVPLLSDLGLHLLNPDGKAVPGTLYAKVVRANPGSNRCFSISFTALPADAEAFLRSLTAHTERVD
jgi:class 3 adenylate cyclase